MVTQPMALIVEDEPAMAGLLVDLLEDLGYTTQVETNGHNAFRLITTHHYTLITLDISLEGWDGVETLNSLDLVQERAPILVITGRDVSALQAEVDNPHIIGFLQKPFDLKDFRQIASKLLQPVGE